MVDGGDEWVSVSEAARRLGVTRSAIRNRVKRGTLLHQSDNHGHPMVRVPVAPPGTVRGGPSREVPVEPVPPDTLSESSGTISLDDVRRLLGEQSDRMERQHAAELARIQSQTAGERQFWIERADAAELRAQEANGMLRDLVDKIMAMPEPAGSWWGWLATLFGSSKRSKVGEPR